MHVGIVYYAGPKSRWLGSIDESEIIKRLDTPWAWLTRRATLSIFKQLDSRRCGYALLKDGICIEQFDPLIPEDEYGREFNPYEREFLRMRIKDF